MMYRGKVHEFSYSEGACGWNKGGGLITVDGPFSWARPGMGVS